MLLQPGGQGGIGRLQIWIFQACQGPLQALADAIAQFGGGGLGKGHHQQLAQPQFGLGHVAQHQLGQGEGFAGAGAGLQQPQPGIQGKGIGLKWLWEWQGLFRCQSLIAAGRQVHINRSRRGPSISSARAASSPLANRAAPLSSDPKQRACSGSSRSPRR